MSRYPKPADLLPHAGPAVLLDEIVHDEENWTHVRVHIDTTHPWFESGHGVPAWVGIEMMAQVVAVHAGLVGRQAGRGPREGMLLGTRRFESKVAWFEDGDTLDLHGCPSYANGEGMGACDCRIERNGEVLAEATIIIIEKDAA